MSQSVPRAYPLRLVRVSGTNTDWASLIPSSSPPVTPRAGAVPNASPTSPPFTPSPSQSPRLPARKPSSTTSPTPPTPGATLTALLRAPVADLTALRRLAWHGLPPQKRATAWRLLLGYAPASAHRRTEALARKRAEYAAAVEQHYNVAVAMDTPDAAMRQIVTDVPRTVPSQKLFKVQEVAAVLTRVLYVWAVRHPASGYVQGMNDLVTPFLYVFLTGCEDEENFESEENLMTEGNLKQSVRKRLQDTEADAYWCLTTLLNDIQDYYTFAQPGIQRRVHHLKELVGKVDAPLRKHLEEEGLDFLQFAFRWMNCLLMRELPFPLIVRVWDTYLSEPDGFAVFHVYVCAALLVRFRDELVGREFQDLVMFLQNLPTKDWTHEDIDMLLSQAYMWRIIFDAGRSHLQGS